MARIEHFALFGDDLATLREFYEGVMGLRVIVDNSKAPVRGFFLADDGGSVLEVIERPPNTPRPSARFSCHAAFLVEDYDASKADLIGRGAMFETDTEVVNDAMKTGFFNDPEGNRVQIVWRSRPLGT